MIECIFTLDYEIYGNGDGALAELVHEPAQRLAEVFRAHGHRFVNFVEVAEFEMIDRYKTDPAIGLIKRQVRELYEDGFEIALHLHPQWYNARYENGRWQLDLNEYNLCTLSKSRIREIVARALDYMRHLVGDPRFTPLSFRAGNWLFQPTENAASVLAEHGIRLDSSVFKGGLQHNYGLDYRASLKNAHYWRFNNDANVADPTGSWIEVPVYSEMVGSWRMATAKRMSFGNKFGVSNRDIMLKVNRLRDFLRFRYPLKFDFCRMTLDEITSMMDHIIREDRDTPELLRPVVAIGHTKDLVDVDTVNQCLAYLNANQIRVSTFTDIYSKLECSLDKAKAHR